MSNVSIYLFFDRQTEAAFNFYKSVFGTELEGNGFMRYGDAPPMEGKPPMGEAEKKLIMHCSLPIVGGFRIMGSDLGADDSKIVSGNQTHILLQPDTKIETDQLFAKLSAGGKVTFPLQYAFWGDYHGTCVDRYGVQWMFNFEEKKSLL